MTSTVTDVALTKDDIVALRSADSITFHYGPENTRYVATCIRAHTRNRFETPVIWTAKEQRVFPEAGSGTDRVRVIMPEASVMSGYAGEHGGSYWHADAKPNAVAFDMIHSASGMEWQTIVGLMRVGDTIHLAWSADNNNDNHRSVGFHCDELRLTIVHSETVSMTFLLTRSVGPHNSARMIRPDGL